MAKTAETLDMLEKGQLKLRTDFGFDENALDAVNRLVAYAIRALLIVAFFVGSCLLCSASAGAGDGAVNTIFKTMGMAGYGISVFFAFCLHRDMKKKK